MSKTKCRHNETVQTADPLVKICLDCRSIVRTELDKTKMELENPPDLGISVSEKINTEDKMV